MALNNYTDLSVGSDVGAGFQFEFRCSHCEQRWKSPFKPYRMGQISGLITRFAFLLSPNARNAGRASSNFADMGVRNAKAKALSEAMVRADALYTVCHSCHQPVCGDCFDSRQDICRACGETVRQGAEHDRQQAAPGAAASCPSCHQPHAGGRFCAECGYDMASTHKSCPACGAMTSRQARFCTDCGHGF